MRTSSFLLAGFVAASAFGPAMAQPTTNSGRYEPARPAASSGYDPSRDPRSDGGYAEDEGGTTPDLMRELNLRPGQTAALADYKAAFQPDTQREARDRADEARLPSMSTPERLDYAGRQMEADRRDFDRTAAATRRFYAQLSPDQQRSFDRLTAPPSPGSDDDQPPPRPERR